MSAFGQQIHVRRRVSQPLAIDESLHPVGVMLRITMLRNIRTDACEVVGLKVGQVGAIAAVGVPGAPAAIYGLEEPAEA